MICCIAFCQKDAKQAHDLLLWITQLGGVKAHDCLLVCDAETQWDDVLKARMLAEKAFKDVHVTANPEHVEGWIPGSTSLFRAAAEWCDGRPFLFLEPDACPLKPTWLDELESAHAKCGKPFMGTIVNHQNAHYPNPYFEGNAVYPTDCWKRFAPIWKPEESWTKAMVSVTIPNAVHTDLIHHIWGMTGNPPVFAEKNTPGTNVFSLAQIPPRAVVFHRCKDGSLIRLLRQRMGIHVPKPNDKADFVSLRRNGDIINLLPLCLELSKRWNRPVRLVVHRDFMPLLEGVSYVEGVPWDGEWENPLIPAVKFNAKNAQVFGKGIRTDTRGTNFAKLAWKQIGYRWNRHLPLVFDRRDHSREAALASTVFKTTKPKILVKVHGFSSPFGEGAFISQKIHQQFDSMAEVVNLDEVKAERLYDLIGLMDRAACLVTADTCALWLAHASKCPMIQFVNNNPFGASPSRGNCLLRIAYKNAPLAWPRVSRVIRDCLDTNKADTMALVYPLWNPKEPLHIERNAEAKPTWELLKANRTIAFKNGRSSIQMGDVRDMCFVRDMIIDTFNNGTEDIVVLTNNDIRFDPALRDAILESCRQFGCYWAYRVPEPGQPTDEGADVFAFTRWWWGMHQHQIPDFLHGYYWYDDVFVRVMRWSGCPEGKRLYYHRPHFGARDREWTAGAKYNDRLAKKWLSDYDEAHEKPFTGSVDCIKL